MRSLFIKIFLWFWLANMLVVGVLVLTTIGTPFGPDHERLQVFAGRVTGSRDWNPSVRLR
jgi:hypothetical protein